MVQLMKEAEKEGVDKKRTSSSERPSDAPPNPNLVSLPPSCSLPPPGSPPLPSGITDRLMTADLAVGTTVSFTKKRKSAPVSLDKGGYHYNLHSKKR